MEEDFYKELLEETYKAFEKSPIREKQLRMNKKWNYAICETPIYKNRELIFGLNWGGNDGFEPQIEYPQAVKKRDWSFLKGTKKYINDYLGIEDIGTVNYSNLCFFRSPNIGLLEKNDWKLSLPLFRKYTEYIEPNKAILLGIKGIEILKETGNINEHNKLKTEGCKRTIFTHTGKLFGKYDLYCLPHPQAHISTSDRNKAWQDYFKSNNTD